MIGGSVNRLLLSFALVPLLATPALAATPSEFMSQGIATSFATANSPEQSTPVKFYYRNGMVRLELKMMGGTPSVILAHKGSSTVTMLDPTQKMAFTTSLAGFGSMPGAPPLNQLMDATQWKSILFKRSHRLPGTAIIGNERCSIWENTSGPNRYKVWFDDKQDLPMQLEGRVNGKLRFRYTVYHLSTYPVNRNLFTVPAGYHRAQLTRAKS